jgi:hypothetical protein
MRRAAAALVITGVMAACGGGGDGGGDGAPAGVSGTVLGQPFDPRDGGAIRLTEEACLFDTNLGQIQANASALLVGFGTFEDLCGFAQRAAACGEKANATIVNVIVLRANVLGGSAAPIQAGTYAISAANATPAPDAQGNVTFATAIVSRSDATCTDTSGNLSTTGSSITLEQVGPDRVTGSANVTFSDGGSVSGRFDVPVCAFSTDVCSGLGAGCDPAAEVCVP